MKLICSITLAIAFLVIASPAAPQSKRAQQKPVAARLVLSDWIRHVGLHYVDLVNNLDKAQDDHARAMYNKFLDEEDASLNIDAHGTDRLFVRDILRRLRSHAEFLLFARADGVLKPENAYGARMETFISCKVSAESAITDGVLEPDYIEACRTVGR